jgi:hypothetical protein
MRDREEWVYNIKCKLRVAGITFDNREGHVTTAGQTAHLARSGQCGEKG